MIDEESGFVADAALSCVRGPHSLCDLRTLLPLYNANVILTLQVEPELSAIAEVATKAHRGISRNRTTTIENISDTA